MYDDERKFSGGSQPLHDIKMQLGCYGAITDEENDLLKASATAASATNYKLPVVSHLLERRARLQTATENPTIDRSVCTCFDEFMGDYIAQKYPDKVKTNALNSILNTWIAEFDSADSSKVKGATWDKIDITGSTSLNEAQQIMRLFAEVEAKAYSQPHLISHLLDTDQAKIKTLNEQGHQPAAVDQNTAFFASGNTVSVTLVASGQAKTPFNQAVDLFNTLNPSHLSMAQITTTEADDVKKVGAHVEKFCKRTARPVLTMKVAEKPWEHARDIHLSLIVIVVATVAFLIRDWQTTAQDANQSDDSWSFWYLFVLTLGNVALVGMSGAFSEAIFKVDKVDWPTVSGASGANFEGTVVNVQYYILWVVCGLLVFVHVLWLVQANRSKAYKQLNGSKMFTVWTNTARFVITALIDVSVILAVAQLSISVLAHQGIMDYTELRSSWIIFFGLGVLSHFAHILHDFIQVYFRNGAQEALINNTILWLIMGIRFTIMATILYWYFQFVGSSQTTSLANNQTDYNGNNVALGFVLSMLLIQLVEGVYGFMDLKGRVTYDMSGSTKYFRAIPYIFLSTVLMLTLVTA